MVAGDVDFVFASRNVRSFKKIISKPKKIMEKRTCQHKQVFFYNTESIETPEIGGQDKLTPTNDYD